MEQGLRDSERPKYGAVGKSKICWLIEWSWKGPTKVGDSPVGENQQTSCSVFPSTAGHVESRGKLGRPLSKAKYSLVTDSEQVP